MPTQKSVIKSATYLHNTSELRTQDYVNRTKRIKNDYNISGSNSLNDNIFYMSTKHFLISSNKISLSKWAN